MTLKLRRPATLIMGIVICVCPLVKATAQQTERTSKRGTRPAGGVAAIEAYCRQLDAFRKRNRPRVFGNIVPEYQETYPVPRDAPRHWEEYANRDAREWAKKGRYEYDGADVWMRNGRLVIAEIQIDRTTDPDRRAIHYFRADGSLAKIYNQYFEVDYYTVKETVYDTEGKVLQTRVRCVDTARRGPGRSVKCPEILPPDVSTPVYRRVEDLPFYDLLKSP